MKELARKGNVVIEEVLGVDGWIKIVFLNSFKEDGVFDYIKISKDRLSDLITCLVKVVGGAE